MKILLFSNEVMPFGGLPTSGRGLRAWQLMKGLESRGFEVVVSMPRSTELAKKYQNEIQEEHRELLWERQTQEQVFQEVKPDALLFSSNWDHLHFKNKPDVPLIIDLHGSRLVQAKMLGIELSREKKLLALSKADCLLTSGKHQRDYFYGWLLQAGRVAEDGQFIRYIPVSLSPNLPRRKYFTNEDRSGPRFICVGNWLPWRDQKEAARVVADAVREHHRGSLEIYGAPDYTLPDSNAQRAIVEAYEEMKELAQASQRMRVNDKIGRDQLMKIYSHAWVALEVMAYSLERELAFAARTVEYLWSGLPVISNNYDELGEHIAEYNAGWIVDPNDKAQLSRVVEEILSDVTVVVERGKNAARLAAERFTWDKTIEPLVDYLRDPRMARESKPVLGTVRARPAFLSPKGQAAEVSLGLEKQEVVQRFIVPAEDLAAVAIPYRLNGSRDRPAIGRIEVKLSRVNGRTIASKKWDAASLPDRGSLTLEFPHFFKPKGGEEVELHFRVVARGELHEGAVVVPALEEAQYPFVAKKAGADAEAASREEGINQHETALALSFVPAELSRWYQFRKLSLRALRMIRQGEWRRFFRALRCRMPLVSRFAR